MADYRKIAEIKANPNNPMVIKDEKYHQLLKSLQDFPEMLKIPVTIGQNIFITFIFFTASFVRGYIIRRIFNAI